MEFGYSLNSVLFIGSSVKDLPTILVLVETKSHSEKALRILPNSNFDSLAGSEANGFAGGIWTFWNSAQVDIKVAANNE